MTEHISDPVFIAIERHRLTDAALDDSIGRGADESVKKHCVDREGIALVALLRTKPETLTGCLAALHYVADWAEDNDAGLFQGWSAARRSAGAAFLPMIADTIETLSQ